MKAREIYLSNKFVFEDGEQARKLLIVLNNPRSEEEPYLIVLTTSQQKKRERVQGCFYKEGYYFLPVGKDWFREDTWIKFNIIYPWSYVDVLKESMSKRNLTFCSELDENNFKQILKCIIKSPDITIKYRKILEASIIEAEDA